VRRNGEIKWQGKLVYITTALIGEPVGLIEAADGSWTANFGPIELGVIAHGSDRLRQPKKQVCGYVDNAEEALTTYPQTQQHIQQQQI